MSPADHAVPGQGGRGDAGRVPALHGAVQVAREAGRRGVLHGAVRAGVGGGAEAGALTARDPSGWWEMVILLF